MVISTEVTTHISANNTYLAYAGACLLSKWVFYGYLGINYTAFNVDTTKTGVYHMNLLALVRIN